MEIESLHAEAYELFPPHVIMASPPQDVLDILLPLAYRYCQATSCFLAPINYFYSAGGARRGFLGQLQARGLLGILLSSPVPAGQVQLIWIVMFRTPVARQLFCATQTAPDWLPTGGPDSHRLVD